MKQDAPIPDFDHVFEMLSRLSHQDIHPALAESIRAQAHIILSHKRQRKVHWRENLEHFYNRILEPVVVSSLVLFYTMSALGRAAILLGF